MSNRTFLGSMSVGLGAALLGWASLATAQPTFGTSSPAAGGTTSQKANEAADRVVYKPVEYTNASKRGPALIVIPGEIKSNNATFLQKFTPNNIADFGEIELSSANFGVLERRSEERRVGKECRSRWWQ